MFRKKILKGNNTLKKNYINKYLYPSPCMIGNKLKSVANSAIDISDGFYGDLNKLLNKKNIDFIEYNIGEDPKKREEMLEKSNGARTVPQIFIGDYHVGGNVELQTLERQSKLDNLLKN